MWSSSILWNGKVQNSGKFNYMEGSVPKEVKAPCKSCINKIYFSQDSRWRLVSSTTHRMHQIRIDNLYILFMIAYPDRPSVAYTLGKPSTKPFANMGWVWTRTFTDSNGHRPTSAMIWAEALLRKYMVLLLLSTSMSEYLFLKYS